jgi:hypothetical protein
LGSPLLTNQHFKDYCLAESQIFFPEQASTGIALAIRRVPLQLSHEEKVSGTNGTVENNIVFLRAFFQ